MAADTYPDTEGGCRDWLRSISAVVTLTAQRQWFGTPDDADEYDFPAITIQRIGGAGDSSDAPIDNAMLQLTVIGARRDKAGAGAIARLVWSELAAIRGPIAWGSTVTCLGCDVESMIFTTDPGDSRPRYTITVTAFTRVT